MALIVIEGLDGSGKGTQGALIKKAFGLAHIESGAIFREHVGGGTELGKKAKEYMDRGELVPDSITIPMVLETLKTKGADGWLLDGFPRNIAQAEQLHKDASDALIGAHDTQTKLLSQEAGGGEMEMTFIMAHAQDTLMTTMILEKQTRFTIDAYKRIAALEAKLA